LRRVQAVAAVLWIAYGVAIAAKPVIAANMIVAAAALGSEGVGLRAAPPSGLAKDLIPRWPC
jgi:hypothetical protein